MPLVENTLGYSEVVPKPSVEELRAFYRNQYFGANAGISQYAYAYNDEELLHKKIIAEEVLHYAGTQPGSVFEIGFGEGFFLDVFERAGWAVSGVDFTDDGIKRFFPRLLDRVTFGDVYDHLAALVDTGQTFDAILCNNVLEHVVDPGALLGMLRKLARPGGLVRLSVPNDGSWLQHDVVRRGLATPDFWVCPPEHLSYFTVAGLRNLLSAQSFDVLDTLTEFPIDVFLLNPDSNYQRERPKGRNCHFARVAFEVSLYRQSREAFVNFRRACADAGLGRNTIAFARPRSEK